FPKDFKLFDIDFQSFKQQAFSIVGKNAVSKTTIISIPNTLGELEDFELTEASNFEPALQERFPEIRAYTGKGITDKYAILKLSVSPQGIQTMVLRADRENEFIEPYSSDQKVYAVFKSQRKVGRLPWTCSTTEKQLTTSIDNQVTAFVAAAAGSSSGTLKTLRLAQSCNGEYSRYFGATSSLQESLVLAAYNATLTRCNGVYETDLSIHLNLISETTNVIYYDPTTDPYTTMSNWNSQLQSTLTSVIGEANYDIGHMFGASGGGGNAGCIGCVCTNGKKGSGITSPADAIPQGDNFDIDYVVHEVGHQLGANHTFSMSNEGTGQNKEVGSGITIMGYAGITSQDVSNHSIDIFHATSIAQITSNLSGKTCPVTTDVTANNVAPVVGALSNYTIPISTPFALTGSATDAKGGTLTFCWEQNDNASSRQTGSSSVASPTKATGPNWISFRPSTSPTRYFPKLETILAGSNVSGPLPGGDANANTEALSSVARTLNFRLTVRDNAAYNSTSVGQTAYGDVVVTVDGTSGPFAVTSPNTAVNWAKASVQTVTWDVKNTNLAPINCSKVKITLSIDGGLTFPTVLAESTDNDGTEAITLPNSLSTTARIKIESIGNIFFDISNKDFTIGDPPLCGAVTGLASSSISNTGATVSWTAVTNATGYDVDYKKAGDANWTVFATAQTQSATSASITGLTQGTLYDWRVRSKCTAGYGSYSTAQFATTSPSCQSAYDASTNDTRAGASSILFNTDIKGLINPSGDLDYYKFVIGTTSTVTLSLTTLPADYDLRLYNSANTLLASSIKSGTSNESISTSLTLGTYYAHVSGYRKANNSTSCYTLNVSAVTTGKMSSLTTDSKMSSQEMDLLDKKQEFISVYPNPVNQLLHINLSGMTGTSEIALYNLNGAKLMSTKTNASSTQFDLSNLPGGIYMISVINSGKIADRVKVIKL
ncbi:MAG: reprolysin-like metallopeptidase, partial [Chitinophagaceae bacterium]